MANQKDLYEILGIEHGSDADKCKKAFRKKALELHPDRHANDSDEEKKRCEDEFKEVQRAYDVLSDPKKKEMYDNFGVVDDGNGPSGGSDPFADFGGFGGFGFDAMRNMFGGGFASQRQRYQPGQNVRITIPISIEDLYCGLKKKIKYSVNVRCPNCHGDGGKTHKCPHCHGRGIITETQRSGYTVMTQQRPCPHCNGTGEVIDSKCPTCNGTGFKKEERIKEVEFPAGIQNLGGIQYTEEGSEAKKAGGPNGDLIVVAQWQFDTSRYDVNGMDITEKVKIPYYDALLGTKLSIILPDKKEIAINIAPCTPPGKRLALRGRGISGRNQFGQQIIGSYIVEINYDIPEKLSDAEFKALEKIKKASSGD